MFQKKIISNTELFNFKLNIKYFKHLILINHIFKNNGI